MRNRRKRKGDIYLAGIVKVSTVIQRREDAYRQTHEETNQRVREEHHGRLPCKHHIPPHLSPDRRRTGASGVLPASSPSRPLRRLLTLRLDGRPRRIRDRRQHQIRGGTTFDPHDHVQPPPQVGVLRGVPAGGVQEVLRRRQEDRAEGHDERGVPRRRAQPVDGFRDGPREGAYHGCGEQACLGDDSIRRDLGESFGNIFGFLTRLHNIPRAGRTCTRPFSASATGASADKSCLRGLYPRRSWPGGGWGGVCFVDRIYSTVR